MPHIEEGTVTFIGATTENPSFELNNALLSRARVYVLKSLDDAALVNILETALAMRTRGSRQAAYSLDEEQKSLIASAADGDARRCLTCWKLLRICLRR